MQTCHLNKKKKHLILGQNGKVYKGLYKKTGAEVEVAIKTIKMSGSEKEKENFIKEMNVMSKLLHPNIVRLFGLTKEGISNF